MLKLLISLPSLDRTDVGPCRVVSHCTVQGLLDCTVSPARSVLYSSDQPAPPGARRTDGALTSPQFWGSSTSKGPRLALPEVGVLSEGETSCPHC